MTASHSHSFDSVSIRAAISRICAALEKGAVSQRDVVYATGIEKSKLSRWLNGKSGWASIGEENYRQILDFFEAKNLFGQASYERPIAANLKDLAFHGMADFLGMGRAEIDSAREKLTGYYIGYRFSYYAAPAILKGKLEISYDEASHALHTLEHYRVPAGALGEGSPEINFMRQGYIWPTHLNMYMMVSKKVQGEDIQISYLNKSLLNAITLEKEALHTVEGVLLDWQGPDFYMTKVFLQKVPKPLPEKDVGLVDEDVVAGPILAKLKDPFNGPHEHLRTYK